MADVEQQDQTSSAAAPKGAKHRTPPYIAYKTNLNLIGDLKAHGVPPVIDRTVLQKFAGGLQGQIMIALRSLGLMDDDNKPTPRLQALVDAYDTPAFKGEMRKIIEDTYPYVLALDLTTATPGMFANAFKDNLDAKEDVLRKCRTFFLNAARDVGIPIGPRIEKAKFPRVRNNGAKKPKPAPKSTESPEAKLNPEKKPEPDGGILELMLKKFPDFDPGWSEDLKAKWFEGFEQFMKRTDKGGS